MAKATASPPARRRSGDRPRGKAKTPKHKTTETSQPKHESPRKHEINRGFIAPFLLTGSVHFHAAIWHNLSPPLTPKPPQSGYGGRLLLQRQLLPPPNFFSILEPAALQILARPQTQKHSFSTVVTLSR